MACSFLNVQGRVAWHPKSLGPCSIVLSLCLCGHWGRQASIVVIVCVAGTSAAHMSKGTDCATCKPWGVVPEIDIRHPVSHLATCGNLIHAHYNDQPTKITILVIRITMPGLHLQACWGHQALCTFCDNSPCRQLQSVCTIDAHQRTVKSHRHRHYGRKHAFI